MKKFMYKNYYMKIISTKTHGILDYLMGLVLIASPWIFGFADGTAAQWIPVILGAGALVYSLMTNYELGVVKTIPMKTHLMLDMGAGALLAVSPWLFGFADRVSTPHVVLGILELGAALMTRTSPTASANARHSHAV
jgi:hypothetical protein